MWRAEPGGDLPPWIAAADRQITRENAEQRRKQVEPGCVQDRPEPGAPETPSLGPKLQQPPVSRVMPAVAMADEDRATEPGRDQHGQECQEWKYEEDRARRPWDIQRATKSVPACRPLAARQKCTHGIRLSPDCNYRSSARSNRLNSPSRRTGRIDVWKNQQPRTIEALMNFGWASHSSAVHPHNERRGEAGEQHAHRFLR